MKNKKIYKIPIIILIISIIVAIVLIFNREKIVDNKKTQLRANEITQSNESQIGEKAIISSAEVLNRITGTEPFDSNDEPGNDSSSSNNIVRSFDKVTWKVDITMGLKSGMTETNLYGGKINIKVELPEDNANVVEWDLESMQWIEDGVISEDGRIITGSYIMPETEITIPGKQGLEFVLNTEGIGNKIEIIPTFEFNLEGNSDTEKYTMVAEPVIVSATGKYNIQLSSNAQLQGSKTAVDYGTGETEGRMYGYGFTMQLCNDTVSKGLKGIEYPKGEITFDIELGLKRTKMNSNELDDITSECTPVLWNYKINNWGKSTEGIIPNREMYNYHTYFLYHQHLPLGVYDNNNPEYTTFNSGNISITQEENILHVTINNYDFNGIFPHYESSYADNPARVKKYDENIGIFSVGYMQIFVPFNDATSSVERKYYLVVSDKNMNITSVTDEKVTAQMNNNDDSETLIHDIYKKGTYTQSILLYGEDGYTIESSFNKGDAKQVIGDNVQIYTKFRLGLLGDDDVYTANKFLKFDAEAFEPIYYSNGDKYRKLAFAGDAEFRVWYVTKKDGTNWKDRIEMTNSNIENMDIYDNIEDIPNNKLCVGIYFETISGNIVRSSGNNNIVGFLFKVKETAQVGKTYGITQRTQMWVEKLDRNKYSILYPENKYPTADYDSGNILYIKTEYNEEGNIIANTHTPHSAGTTLLVVGANLHGNISTIDQNENTKTNYDLGKNENIVTYKVEPKLDKNENLATQISGVTLKATVTLPKGLEYIEKSSNYEDPESIVNSDGTTTLRWYIENCTTGDNIEPIIFNAQIDNETLNGTKYTTKFVISEEIGSDGVVKIGNSEINNRTSSTDINVINLASHRLYKEVNTNIIENSGELKYKIVYENKTEENVADFQLLDILPYTGDSRGSRVTGTYKIKQINIKRLIGGKEQENANIKLYTTNSEEVRSIDAKNTEIGISNIWQEKIFGTEISEEGKGIAIKGEVKGQERIEIEIILETEGNKSKDVYINNAMAQIFKNSEQIITGNIETTVLEKVLQEEITVTTVVTVTDDMSDIKEVKFAWSTDNKTPPTNYINREGDLTVPMKITEKLGEGTYYLWVRATDGLGNVTEKVSEPFIVKKPLD